jgi:porin
MLDRGFATGIALLAISVATALPASAQENPNSTVSVQNTTPAPLPKPTPLQKLGKDLEDDGIYLTSRITGQAASNPIGGQKQRTDYANDITAGVTLDLGKLGGVQGGLIHILFDQRMGRLLSDDAINSSLSVQNIFGAGQTFQLAILTYEQKLFDDKVDINLGRTDTAFLTLPYFCDFQTHGDCGRPFGLAKMTSSSVYPEAVWGGRLLYNITPNFYTKLGVYQPNPTLEPQITHGFDWTIDGKFGIVTPAEFGYKYYSPGMNIPNQYGIGYVFSHAPFTAPFAPTLTHLQDRGAVYGLAEQTVWQPEPGQRGISLFGMVLNSTQSGTQLSEFQDSFGAIWQGPWASRPDDRIGFQYGDYLFTRSEIDFLAAKRAKAGGTDRPHNNEQTMEINYMAQATPWLQIMPNLQYIIHPDGMGGTVFPNANIKNALVIGLQFSIDLPTLAGMPSYPLPLVQNN